MRGILLLPLALLTAALAGCAADDHREDDDHMMGPGSYRMELDGMPQGPMAPGHKFNVTVRAMAGMSGMNGMMSDHIGAHFWNQSVEDPTGALANATTCQHRAAEAPGEWTAMCTAPMQPGTYRLRSHMRMMDDAGETHHWWSDEQGFTVE